ncbi:MAG TPA: HypC/HybG/HupF family hydrogenase formation chaperone [Deinococcales bacterium]|nr:HypC/HybG/HupF family hydrogenase formation chaperone [Deinococcales bacterium]
MCLGVPCRVVELLDAERAVVAVGEGRQTCFTGLIEDLKVGDWVILHAGFALERLDEAAARENLDLIEEQLAESREGASA